MELSQKVFGLILIGRFGTQSLVGCFEFIHGYAVIIHIPGSVVIELDIYLGVSAIEMQRLVKGGSGRDRFGPESKRNPPVCETQIMISSTSSSHVKRLTR